MKLNELKTDQQKVEYFLDNMEKIIVDPKNNIEDARLIRTMQIYRDLGNVLINNTPAHELSRELMVKKINKLIEKEKNENNN